MSGSTLISPLGSISVSERNGVLCGLHWRADDSDASDLTRDALLQLHDYFAGTRQVFDLPLDYGGDFQRRVRYAMAAIPFGETRTYGDLARDLGAPAQAVGQACGANPLPILIPCHRVLGARGLGGFSAKGGVETKVWLLRHEGAAGLLI